MDTKESVSAEQGQSKVRPSAVGFVRPSYTLAFIDASANAFSW